MKEDVIISAILHRLTIEFVYNGRHRVVHPHTYGIDSKNHRALRGYQVAGSSNGRIPDWRIFHLDSIEGSVSTTTPFATSPRDYVRGDKLFSTILAQV